MRPFSLFLGNLKLIWSKQFTIMQVFPYGGVEVSHQEKGTFKVHGQRLKPYFGGGFNESKA